MCTKDKTFGLNGVVKIQTCLFLSKPSETIVDFFTDAPPEVKENHFIKSQYLQFYGIKLKLR